LISLIILTGVALGSGIVVILTKSFSFHSIWNIVFPLCFVSGILVVCVESREINVSFEMRKWPTTKAKIISSQVAGVRAFHPNIRYEYQVDEVYYSDSTDMDLPGFGSKRTRLSDTERIVDENPVGTAITVHYNPDNPAISKVHVHASYSTYLIMTMSAMIYGVGCFGILCILARHFDHRRSRSQNL
jgi:hypothetical protein